MSFKQSDKDFQAALAARLAENTAPAASQVMRLPPTGPSKSLADLIGDEAADNSTKSAPTPAASAATGTESATSSSETVVDGVIHSIGVHLVVDSPYQPRTKYNEDALQALGAMLQDNGQDEPVIVRKRPGGRFELIAGHRRIRAARLIGWGKIKARIVEYDDSVAERATLTSNEGREGLSDYERAISFQRAKDRGLAKTQEDIARMFGCTQPRVSQCLGLLTLPAPVLQLLDDYPSLVNYRFVPVISELIGKYHDAGDAIKKELQGLIDNPELTPDDIRVSIEKQFRQKRPPIERAKPQVVSDENGDQLYKVKTVKKQIVIDVDNDEDVAMTGKRIMAALREIAQTRPK